MERMKRLDRLIRRKETGSPLECAKLLGISSRHLYNMIEDMNDMGAHIEYDLKAKTYYYRIDGEFQFGFIPNNNS